MMFYNNLIFDHDSIVAPDPYFFGLPIRWYSVFIAIGIFLAYLICNKEAKKKGMDDDLVIELITFGFPLCIIGARLYFIVFNNPGLYLQNPGRIFGFYPSGFGGISGLAIHGGIIAAGLFGWWFLKRKKVPLPPMLDIAAVGFFVGQMMGRLGNFMNQEVFGRVVAAEGLDAQREFLTSLFIPNFIVDGMLINGNYHHPTFLYEIFWNLIGFLVAVFVLRKLSKILIGEIAAFYAVWYSFGRFFIEALRTDSLMVGQFQVAQLISVATLVAVLIFVIWRRTAKKEMVFYRTFNLQDKSQDKAKQKQKYFDKQKKNTVKGKR